MMLSLVSKLRNQFKNFNKIANNNYNAFWTIQYRAILKKSKKEKKT